MKWLERLGFAAVGVFATLIALSSFGTLNFSGDFAANVAGATIGGMISVGLAIVMFQHERNIAAADSAAAKRAKWDEAVRNHFVMCEQFASAYSALV